MNEHEELCWLTPSVVYECMDLSYLPACVSGVRRASVKCVRGRKGEDT